MKHLAFLAIPLAAIGLYATTGATAASPTVLTVQPATVAATPAIVVPDPVPATPTPVVVQAAPTNTPVVAPSATPIPVASTCTIDRTDMTALVGPNPPVSHEVIVTIRGTAPSDNINYYAQLSVNGQHIESQEIGSYPTDANGGYTPGPTRHIFGFQFSHIPAGTENVTVTQEPDGPTICSATY